MKCASATDKTTPFHNLNNTYSSFSIAQLLCCALADNKPTCQIQNNNNPAVNHLHIPMSLETKIQT